MYSVCQSKMLPTNFKKMQKKLKIVKKDRIQSYGLLTENTGDRIQNSKIHLIIYVISEIRGYYSYFTFCGLRPAGKQRPFIRYSVYQSKMLPTNHKINAKKVKKLVFVGIFVTGG